MNHSLLEGRKKEPLLLSKERERNVISLLQFKCQCMHVLTGAITALELEKLKERWTDTGEREREK